MAIKIQSIHFDADKKLLSFIEEKANKLYHFFDSIIEIEVYLKVDKSSERDNKLVEIKVLIPGNELFAKKQCKSFEEATDETLDALKAQIIKYKDKLRQNIH
jgi:putative sigma-54 modulation protein